MRVPPVPLERGVQNLPLSLTSVLLVEVDRELRDSRKLLLSSLAQPVLAVCGYREVVSLPAGSNCSLAVIGVAPDEIAAVRTASHVRHTWPAAKILLLGRPSDLFDDPLYDESVVASGNPAGVVGAARRLLQSP